MNAAEFRKWYAAHRAAFPGIEQELSRLANETSSEGDPVTKESILKSWKASLADIPLSACLEATRQLERGQPEFPRWFDDHKRLVFQVAKRIANPNRGRIRFAGERETYACATCRDVGFVSVYDIPRMRRTLEKYPTAKFPLRMLAMRCSCDSGRRMSDTVMDFDPQKYLRETGDLKPDEAWQAVEQFEASQNRVAAFDDWNNR